MDRQRKSWEKVQKALMNPVFCYLTGLPGSQDRRLQTNIVKRHLYQNSIRGQTSFADSSGFHNQENLPPGLELLFLAVQEAKNSRVVVEHFNRFSTDAITRGAVLTLLYEMGAQVINASASVDEDENSGDLETHTANEDIEVAIQAKVKKWRIHLRLLTGRLRRRAATGRCEGRKRFGMRSEERKTWRRIQELARKPRNGKRRSSQEIANVLNAEGLRTRSQGFWTRWQVYNLLERQRAQRAKGRRNKSNY